MTRLLVFIMNLEIRCPHCNELLEYGPEYSGKESVCPSCQGRILLPKNIPLPAQHIKPLTGLAKVMRSMVIAWTILCVLGMGGCVATTFISASSGTVPYGQDAESFRGGVTLIGLILSAVGWLGIWILVAIPCATIYVVSKKR